jgi:hypothetical protein
VRLCTLECGADALLEGVGQNDHAQLQGLEVVVLGAHAPRVQPVLGLGRALDGVAQRPGVLVIGAAALSSFAFLLAAAGSRLYKIIIILISSFSFCASIVELIFCQLFHLIFFVAVVCLHVASVVIVIIIIIIISPLISSRIVIFLEIGFGIRCIVIIFDGRGRCGSPGARPGCQPRLMPWHWPPSATMAEMKRRDWISACIWPQRPSRASPCAPQDVTMMLGHSQPSLHLALDCLDYFIIFCYLFFSFLFFAFFFVLIFCPGARIAIGRDLIINLPR